jgi:serine/threonine-protein kinase
VTSRSSARVGAVVAGRFEIERALGEGAAGKVWVARDRVLGIQVALKVLRTSMRISSEQLAAFAREAEVCLRMLSPNIVRVIAYGAEVSTLPFIAYELLEGETLDARLTRGPRLMLDEVENVIVQVARGLARAHALGVIHRDIQPANVFLSEDERGSARAKLLDFGIASLRGEGASSAADEVRGTLEYLAPEVLFQTSAPDARSDVYALASLTYACLVGVPPLQADSLPQLVARMAAPSLAPPTVAPLVGRAAAEELDAFFARGVSKDPVERFASARELAEELHRVIKIAKLANPDLVAERASREPLPWVEVTLPPPRPSNPVSTGSTGSAGSGGGAPSRPSSPSRRSLRPTTSLAAPAAVTPPLPTLRPRAPSFAFFEEEDPRDGPSRPSRDPRRE